MTVAEQTQSAPADRGGRVKVLRSGADLVLEMAGSWRLESRLPGSADVTAALDADPKPSRVRFDATALADWDSSLLTFLLRVVDLCSERGIPVETRDLPAGLQRLVALSLAVPEMKDARSGSIRLSVLSRVGTRAIAAAGSLRSALSFLGEVTIGIGKALGGKARFRGADFAVLVQQAGADALPIVSLVSFLLGLILAFVGAIQLQQFGASIFVANLVGIAMVRDMGALMTGIVMTGRSGAAYAAQLGSMGVNEEIDALVTTGLSPIEFLVVPRVLALTLMMPLLTLYADLLGILGGAFVGLTMLGHTWTEYTLQTRQAVEVSHVLGGMFKGAVYGSLVGLTGCLQGMRAGRSAAGVGDATTSAVVTGIVAIIVACGLFAWAWYVLGI